MGVENLVGERKLFVLDTSFLIDASLGNYWTLEPFKAIRHPSAKRG